MKKFVITLAVCFALVSANPAFAISPNLDQGTFTMDLYGSYDGNHPLDYQLVLGVGLGIFAIDNLEFSGVLGWQSNDVSDMLEVGLVAEYNLNFGSPVVPFIQIGGLWTGVELDDDFYNEEDGADEDAWLGRAGGGFKFFVIDDVAINLSAVYDYASKEIYPDEDGNFDDYNWKALLGISVYIN